MRKLEISTGNTVFCPVEKKEVHTEVCVAGCGLGIISNPGCAYVECYFDDAWAAELESVTYIEARRRYGDKRFKSETTGG